MTKTVDTEKEWHLDKRVPIALICTLLAQTFILGWWTSRIDSRVASLEQDRVSSVAQATQLTNIAIDIAVMKANAETQKIQMMDIKTAVQKLTDMRSAPGQ